MTNNVAGTVSVIDAATSTAVGTPIAVGSSPTAFGLFIGPAVPRRGPPVPTLSEWGLIAMALLLGLVAWRRLPLMARIDDGRMRHIRSASPEARD